MVSFNSVLSLLELKDSDRVISIRENGSSDANFLVTHLIKQALQERSKVCLVAFHHDLSHYHNVGKRLGYDFFGNVDTHNVRFVDALGDIGNDIGNEKTLLSSDKSTTVDALFDRIAAKFGELAVGSNSRVYLIVDDVSHLLDLGIQLEDAITFVNYCVSLSSQNAVIVINTHVSNKQDRVVANSLNYTSDVVVEVSPLKSGMSREVTGLLTVERLGTKASQFHYKTFDKGVKTFHVGESLYNLYK